MVLPKYYDEIKKIQAQIDDERDRMDRQKRRGGRRKSSLICSL